MGTITSKSTRRISFDNNFALSPPLTVQNSIDNRNIINCNEISSKSRTGVFFQETEKFTDSQEAGEIDYWSQRIESMKKEHQIINTIIETEYDKKIDSTYNTFHQPKGKYEKIQKIKSCFDWSVKIVKCYEDNPHEPLACSATVQAFNNCVASCRMEE